MPRRPYSPFLPPSPSFGAAVGRTVADLGRATLRAGTRLLQDAARQQAAQRRRLAGAGEWIAGVAFGAAGPRRYRLFRPAGVASTERLPLLVMLHGCGQDAASFAASTRMNRLAARERFLVLYPEQDRGANPNGCWHWFDTRAGRAQAEAATILAAVDQVLLLYPADRGRVALAGLSAGASMAALLATRAPERFRSVAMHSGVPPGTAHSTASALAAMRGRREPGTLDAGTALPALLVIHGSHDAVVDAANARAAVLAWSAGADAREGDSRTVRRGARRGMTVTDFKARGRTVATLCEIDALGHAWSGGDATHAWSDADGPDASRLVWRHAAREFARGAVTPKPGDKGR